VEGIYRLRQHIRQYQIGMKLSKQKNVRASDKVVCGNVIAEYNDNNKTWRVCFPSTHDTEI
jgi:hypothetical protein